MAPSRLVLRRIRFAPAPGSAGRTSDLPGQVRRAQWGAGRARYVVSAGAPANEITTEDERRAMGASSPHPHDASVTRGQRRLRALDRRGAVIRQRP